jgi:hypothetical protein
MSIHGEGYTINYEPEQAAILCTGILDLRGKEGYLEVSKLLEEVVGDGKPSITLDLRGLEFLNSSGITTLGGFIIKLRDKGGSSLRVLCSNQYTWQSRSMQGLQRLLPGMTIEFD